MRIDSHQYEFTTKELLLVFAPPLLVFAIFALAIHGGAAVGLLPPPCPALDTDRTILLHQATASRNAAYADVLCIGDSSCLMDVSAVQLADDSKAARSVLNLGTLSYLDLNAYAAMLKEREAANRKPALAVVLLMHPEALRRAAPSEYHAEALRHFIESTDYCGPNLPTVLCALGVETFRGRILSRALPQPLGGDFGRYYGFTHDLWENLSVHHGSAHDPGQFNPETAQGNAEYRLAPSLEAASRALSKAAPRGAKLLVGITPIPESFARPGYGKLHAEMLKQWGAWLQADGLLTELPPIMRDDLFASTTHLNERGVKSYTHALGRALDSRLEPDQRPLASTKSGVN